MREFLTFLTAVAILAIAQTLASALGVVLLIFAVMGVVAFPRQTFGLIASLGLLALALRAPAACAAALGCITVAIIIADRVRPRPVPLRLTDQREQR